jgi:hypothetical protein
LPGRLPKNIRQRGSHYEAARADGHDFIKGGLCTVKRFLTALAVLALAAHLAGCGGSLGEPSGLLSATVTSTVNWTTNTAIKSAVLLLTDKNGKQYTLTVHPTDPQPYTISDEVPVGTASFTANFFAVDVPSGNPVSTVNIPQVDIEAPRTNIPISVQPPAKIVLIDPQTVVKGQEATLNVLVFDKDNNYTVANANSIVLSFPSNEAAQDQTILQIVNPGGGLKVQGLQLGTVHVIATLGILTSTATVNVVSGIKVALSASDKSVTLSPGQTHAFSATVTNSTAGVNWSISEAPAGGTIVPNASDLTRATYTAPIVPGTYHVTATSVEDPSVKDTATVTVQSNGTQFNFQ